MINQPGFWPFHRILLTGALLTTIASYLVTEIYDLDLWWHLIIGRDILANAAVPVVDSYTAVAAGRAYHDSHWFFQVLMTVAHRRGGMVGCSLLMIAIWGATLYFCYRAIRAWLPASWGMMLLFLVVMASLERFLPRPEIMTFLGIAFFFWRLQEGKYQKPMDLALLALMQVVWANSHGLFVLGPFMVGCYFLVAGSGLDGCRRRELGPLGRLLAVVVVATMVSPFGLGHWQYALLLFEEAGPSASRLLKSVGELSPTFGALSRSGLSFWFFLLLLLAAAVALLLAAMRRDRQTLARTLVVLALFAAALSGRRNMVLFALVGAPFAAEHLRHRLVVRPPWEKGLALAAAMVMFGFSWYALSGYYHLKMEIPARFGLGATPSFFPHQFPSYAADIGFRGQVFNSNTIGGFDLYHGYPQRRPFTDGRWEIYDQSIFDRIEQANNPLALKRLALDYNLEGLLLQHTSLEARRFLPFLPQDPQWRLVFLDQGASFWLRRNVLPLTPVLDLTASGALPEIKRVEDGIMLDFFLRDVGAHQLRLRNLQRTLAFGPQQEFLLSSRGQTELALQRFSEAEATFRAVLARYPKNLIALNESAYLAFRRNDVVGAEGFLRQLLRIDPRNQDALANLQRIRQRHAAPPGES